MPLMFNLMAVCYMVDFCYYRDYYILYFPVKLSGTAGPEYRYGCDTICARHDDHTPGGDGWPLLA